MIQGLHYQNAYVTRNVDKAVAEFKARAEVRHEQFYDGPTPLITAAGDVGEMVLKLALLWVGDMQYEFIEPVSGQMDIYRKVLPADDTPVFHHIAMRIDDWSDFQERVSRQSLPIAQRGKAGDLNFLYLDARSWIGHHLEFTHMPDEMWSAMGGR